MTTSWIVIVAVVGGILVLGLLGVLIFGSRIRAHRTDRRHAQARDQLAESQRKMAEAASTQAALEEKAARARRDRADAELRVAESERERLEKQPEADRQRAEAAKLRESAARLDPSLDETPVDNGPGLTDEPQGEVQPTTPRG